MIDEPYARRWAEAAHRTNYCSSVYYNIARAQSKKRNPDIFTWWEVLKDTDRLDGWMKAAATEIADLEAKDAWDEVPLAQATSQVVPLVWTFRIKRSPDGEVKKLKARICKRGDLENLDEDTYCPTVAWPTVRLFLVLAMTLKWVTVSVDWANAFIQTPLKQPEFVGLPQGFRSRLGQSSCLRLKKSLYGSVLAPKRWYEYLRDTLLDMGLKQCPHDKCMFYKKDLLMVLYVDDAGIAAPKRSIIDDLVEDLRSRGFELDIEGDFNEYLGIKIDELDHGTRVMTQKGLIQKVISYTGLQDCNPNWVPAVQKTLSSDPDGELYDNQEWNYASAVGMLQYLSNNTRPDITFAVSQVARFTNAPKLSHAVALKTIIRYLKRTEDKGIIVNPSGDLNLKVWCDADFSGLYRSEPDQSPDSARSRLGFLITVGNVPLVWKSQLISAICLSTLMAEYASLTTAMRVMIPIRGLLQHLVRLLDLPHASATITSTVFEDNQGCYLLAYNQRLTPNTRYFNAQWHFFWAYVYHPSNNPQGWLIMVKCETARMSADVFTKPLPREVFERHRKEIQGW